MVTHVIFDAFHFLERSFPLHLVIAISQFAVSPAMKR